MTMAGEPSYGYVGSLFHCLIRGFCEPESYGIRVKIIVRKDIDWKDQDLKIVQSLVFLLLLVLLITRVSHGDWKDKTQFYAD